MFASAKPNAFSHEDLRAPISNRSFIRHIKSRLLIKKGVQNQTFDCSLQNPTIPLCYRHQSQINSQRNLIFLQKKLALGTLLMESEGGQNVGVYL